jgi:hypothetical protein
VHNSGSALLEPRPIHYLFSTIILQIFLSLSRQSGGHISLRTNPYASVKISSLYSTQYGTESQRPSSNIQRIIGFWTLPIILLFNDLLVTGLCLRPQVEIILSRIKSTGLDLITGHQKQHMSGYTNQTSIRHSQESRKKSENAACMRSWYVGNSIYFNLNSRYLSGLC